MIIDTCNSLSPAYTRIIIVILISCYSSAPYQLFIGSTNSKQQQHIDLRRSCEKYGCLCSRLPTAAPHLATDFSGRRCREVSSRRKIVTQRRGFATPSARAKKAVWLGRLTLPEECVNEYYIILYDFNNHLKQGCSSLLASGSYSLY
jgi:hypothetical protein